MNIIGRILSMFSGRLMFARTVRDIAVETILSKMRGYTLQQQQDALTFLLKKYVQTRNVEYDFKKWKELK